MFILPQMEKQQHMENCSLADLTGATQTQKKGVCSAFDYFALTTGHYYLKIPALR